MVGVVMRVILLIVLSVIITGAVILVVEHLRRQGPPKPGQYELLPAPWLVPKQAGGTALRLAMVHDVLHERFHLHGEEWFNHRHQQAERELAAFDDGQKQKDDRYFALLDDLAVDFDRLGRPAEGIPILRRKLNLQQPVGADGKRPAAEARCYTTYANLGTLLAHQHLKGALAKDPAALAGLREGLAFIEQAVAVNPDAHFGRERWQVVTLRYLLRASENPKLLTSSDLMGVEWGSDNHVPFGQAYPTAMLQQFRDDDVFRQRLVNGPRDQLDLELVKRLRRSIPLVESSNQEWIEHCGQDLSLPVPFDEPALAFIGIWTLGSGANPHFALALAHLMDGLGQRGIAWNAYERASELAGKFWSDPAIQQELITYCRAQQATLEMTLGQSADTLRKQHQSELADGRAEQAAYQAYEAEQIGAGKDPTSAGFYDDFFRGRQPIASDPGEADTVVYKLPVNRWMVVVWMQAFICTLMTLALISAVMRRRRELTA